MQEEYLKVLNEAAVEAGKLIESRFSQAERQDFSQKTSFKDIVTSTDLASQKFIKSYIESRLLKRGVERGKIGFVGEEDLGQAGEHMFVIDPIDGTTNFAGKLPFFCVSIAYVKSGKITAGVIFDPIAKRLFSAQAGKGAFLKTAEQIYTTAAKRIFVNRETKIKNCLLVAHTHDDEAVKETSLLYKRVRAVRNFGSIALEIAYAAMGAVDIAYNSRCYVWDLAAAAIILKEAGGIIVQGNGKEWSPDWNNVRAPVKIVAGYPKLVKQVCLELNFA